MFSQTHGLVSAADSNHLTDWHTAITTESDLLAAYIFTPFKALPVGSNKQQRQ